MGSTMIFKCPCCGGYLEFEPSLQKFKCLYCGQVLSEEDLRDQSEQREQQAEEAQAQAPQQALQQDVLRTYHCQMCGAQVVTEATTAATRCYYCHTPIVLHDRLDDEFRPDSVVPFTLTREEAEKEFRDYIKRKKFVDKRFFDDAQLEMFSGVYYPWWYCDVEGNASFTGEGSRKSISQTAQYILTTTRYYRVERAGRLGFRNIARKALQKADRQLSDGIHPYRIDEAKPYAAGYLSGFLAETRDVAFADVRQDVLSEVNRYAENKMEAPDDFMSLRGTTKFTATDIRSRYCLLPAWVLTWKGGKDGVPYYYMMNGQTGKICGKLPIDKGKLLLWALGAGVAVFALLCGGGMFLW